jgi:hypothetical protein
MTSQTVARDRAAKPLTKTCRLGIYAVGAGLWLSGCQWLVFHYFLMREDELGPSPHPLEPWWLALHGAFAFAALWTFGLLWGVHVAKNWSKGERRWSGAAFVGILGVLIVTGYLLYYVGDERLQYATSLLHWIVGLAAPAGILAHRFAREKRSRRTEAGFLRKLYDDGFVRSLTYVRLCHGFTDRQALGRRAALDSPAADVTHRDGERMPARGESASQ